MNKTVLRKKYAMIRTAMSPHDVTHASMLIAKHCAGLFTTKGLSVLLYQPISKYREIDPGMVRQYAPAHHYDTVPNHKSASFPEAEYDVIIVPCIAADMNGYRLGYGGGWYDRFLAKQRAITIYVCYESCLVQSLPHEVHDVQGSYVVTEKRIIKIPVE